jgi:hypothetical protein
MLMEDALGYKDADCHGGRTQFRNPMWDDIADE